MQKIAGKISPEVLSAFGIDRQQVSLHPLGEGNINYTYLVRDQKRQFVLQKINSSVFPDLPLVAQNFLSVTRHIATRASAAGIDFQCPQLIPTKDNELSFLDSHGGFWRAQTFIEHIQLGGIAVTTTLGSQLGRILGEFHLLTDDLNVDEVPVSIPGFHNTPSYLSELDTAMCCTQNRADTDDCLLHTCLEIVERYRAGAGVLEDMKNSGSLKPRIIHGDPKLDNMIISVQGKAVGMFDLDTVGAGLIHYDIGDCLRSLCNRAGENIHTEADVRFDINICEAVLGGYFESVGDRLRHDEVSVIYDSIRIISLELGVRFLTDHLNGDLYFKVDQRGDNLRKANIQLRLAESIVLQEKQIRASIANLAS
ncbi:phosphotransferase enzyme family protein [Desulfosediminicola flagellatus]|uniref:phosphotransferase enzyme family protein n=1 Tax=Desulfosediminicola flagellatus TaxID=2569541 RepID=UPI0010ABA896|nr:aminoglycoside phosphotransferase family protein [Desulfosediminicola flagellatus]